MRADNIDGMSPAELIELRRRIDRRLKRAANANAPSWIAEIANQEKVELVALAVKEKGIRGRLLETGQSVTLRPGSGIRSEAEAHILTVRPSTTWVYGQTAYLSGEVTGMRLDISALGLVPLKLLDEGVWDPADEYWGEEGEPIQDCFQPILTAGPRPSFEMEQVVPGMDVDDPDSDPISEAVDLHESGEVEGSRRILHQCLEEDLRCLDAHAHLGNWNFGEGSREFIVEQALKNYSAGVAIGELSMGAGFRGVLSWGRIDNRPFLRCLHGLGLCRWALGDLSGARSIFERMLWLNPSDNQGARYCLANVERKTAYNDFAKR